MARQHVWSNILLLKICVLCLVKQHAQVSTIHEDEYFVGFDVSGLIFNHLLAIARINMSVGQNNENISREDIEGSTQRILLT